MALHPGPDAPVPADTARVARAAFPKGNPYMTLRDELGPVYTDPEFAPLFAASIIPGPPPLTTLMPSSDNFCAMVSVSRQ